MNEKIQAAFFDELEKIGFIRKKITGVGGKVARKFMAPFMSTARTVTQAGGAAKSGAKKILKRFKK